MSLVKFTTVQSVKYDILPYPEVNLQYRQSERLPSVLIVPYNSVFIVLEDSVTVLTVPDDSVLIVPDSSVYNSTRFLKSDVSGQKVRFCKLL